VADDVGALLRAIMDEIEQASVRRKVTTAFVPEQVCSESE